MSIYRFGVFMGNGSLMMIVVKASKENIFLFLYYHSVRVCCASESCIYLLPWCIVGRSDEPICNYANFTTFIAVLNCRSLRSVGLGKSEWREPAALQ